MISSILSAVSLLTLTAISVDRLLALFWGLRYKQVVTLRRVYWITIIFCIVSTASAIIRIFWNSLIVSWYYILCVLLCLVVSTFCYTKIFFTFRHHQNQVQDHIQQPNQTNELNIARYRKAVSNAVWLQVTLIVCYLSYLLLITYVIHAESSSPVSFAWSYLCFTKLVVKPHSLLLEAQRSETSSERHNKTSALLLIELALVELYHLLAY